MLPSQKKSSYKGNNSKFRPQQNNNRYDQTTFDQFQLEYTDSFYREKNKAPKSFTKRIYYPTNLANSSDSTQASNNDIEVLNQSNQNFSQQSLQEKLRETTVVEGQSYTEGTNSQYIYQGIRQKDKRSDKQTRQKQNFSNKFEDTEKQETSKQLETPQKNKSITSSSSSKNKEKTKKEEKDNFASDENNSLVSNVALVQKKYQKHKDEQAENTNSNKKDMSSREQKITRQLDIIQASQGAPCRLLCVLAIQVASHLEYIEIYEDEDNYEAVLDNVCKTHRLKPKAALYLKINVLRLIKEYHSKPSKVEASLNKLLDLNFKIILFENNLEEADETIWPYICDSRDNT